MTVPPRSWTAPHWLLLRRPLSGMRFLGHGYSIHCCYFWGILAKGAEWFGSNLSVLTLASCHKKNSVDPCFLGWTVVVCVRFVLSGVLKLHKLDSSIEIGIRNAQSNRLPSWTRLQPSDSNDLYWAYLSHFFKDLVKARIVQSCSLCSLQVPWNPFTTWSWLGEPPYCPIIWLNFLVLALLFIKSAS